MNSFYGNAIAAVEGIAEGSGVGDVIPTRIGGGTLGMPSFIFWRSTFVAVWLSCCVDNAIAEGTSRTPAVAPALDGIFQAFGTHPLVGLGEFHGFAQELDFYTRIIGDPRFSKDVGNVVVEFGGSAHQEILDRYLAGETIPYNELRKVWTDVVGWVPTVMDMGHINFFAHVRKVNLALPPEQHIHVWLGEPSIDWKLITSAKDLEPFEKRRDQNPAEIITREILAKKKKALVIYGTAHFVRVDDHEVITDLVEKEYPGAFFLVAPYIGFNQKSCSENFERATEGWPVPALATPIRGTTLETELSRPGCDIALKPPPSAPARPPDLQRKLEEMTSGRATNGLLYLGPAHTLMRGPRTSDMYLDPDYRREIDRRSKIIFGRGVPEAPELVSPPPLRRY